jgi:hypothetical protein
MTISSFTLRISGNASLEDNTVVSFLENWDSNNLGDLPQSNLSFRVLYPSKKSEVEALVPYVIVGGQVVPSADPTASPVDVSSVSMVITGKVAYADNSIQSFSFEVRDDGSVYNHTGQEGEDAWLAMAEDPTANALMAQMFTALYATNEDPITVAIVTESVSSESSPNVSTSSSSDSTQSSSSDSTQSESSSSGP